MILKSIFSHVVGGTAEFLVAPITHVRNAWRTSLRENNEWYTGRYDGSLSSPEAVKGAVKDTAINLALINLYSVPAGMLTLGVAGQAIKSGALTGQMSQAAVGLAVYGALCVSSSIGNLWSEDHECGTPVYPLKTALNRALRL